VKWISAETNETCPIDNRFEHVFPRLGKTTYFPALGAGPMFSRVQRWQQLFPPLAPVSRFLVFRVAIGSLLYLLCYD